jgi:hypothetical protein
MPPQRRHDCEGVRDAPSAPARLRGRARCLTRWRGCEGVRDPSRAGAVAIHTVLRPREYWIYGGFRSG